VSKSPKVYFILMLLGVPWGLIIFKLFGRAEGNLRYFEFMLYCLLGTAINLFILALWWRFYLS